MVYNEKAIFKRDIKLRGNNKVTQIRVTGLSVNSKFTDNEEINTLKEENQALQSKVNELETKLNSITDIIVNLEKHKPSWEEFIASKENQK